MGGLREERRGGAEERRGEEGHEEKWQWGGGKAENRRGLYVLILFQSVKRGPM